MQTTSEKSGRAQVSGIILAAGESRRMERPKQLLPWGNTFVLQHVVDISGSSNLFESLLVLGCGAEEILGKVELPGKVRQVINAQYERGMGSSIARGVEEISAEAQAVMILLGDQPLVSVERINHLIDVYSATRAGIIMPVYEGKRGHPVLLDMRYRAELLEISVGAREVVWKHPDAVLEVPVETAHIYMDMDTPQDYEVVKKAAGL